MPPTSQDPSLAAAAAALRRGGVVVFPTETVYGVGANALDPVACARIFEVKGRPRFNPLIVHLADASQLAEVAVPTAAAEALAARFWPGPLTLVLPKRSRIDGIVTGDLDTVGVRVPGHPLARALIAAAGVPVAAPSANRFMALSPTTMAHAQAQLGDSVDAYLDGGSCEVGVESTIVGWIDGKATLLRPGGLDPRLVEAVIGPLAPPPAPGGKTLAPGMLARHYAPRAKLFLEGDPTCPQPGRNVALVCVQAHDDDRTRFGAVVELARDGDLRIAAARLYSALHEIDATTANAIVARLAPEEGLGIAINDRLRRAAAPE
jgi:L-threonylcarbamoyladenylate synthase